MLKITNNANDYIPWRPIAESQAKEETTETNGGGKGKEPTPYER